MPVISYNVSNDSPIKNAFILLNAIILYNYMYCSSYINAFSIHWPINRMQWPTACKKLLLMSLLPLSYSAHKRCSRLLKSRTQFLTRRGSMSSTVVTEKSRRCFSRVVTKHFDNQPCRRAFMADHRLKAAVPRLREVVGSVAC